MKGWVVDTSAYSWGLRGHDEVARILRSADVLVLPPIVIGELLAGFLKGGQIERNRSLLEIFLSSPRVEVAKVSEETAERYAVIVDGLRRAGTPIPTNDAWIAATAMEQGLPIVTTDAHFEKVPQIVTHFVII